MNDRLLINDWKPTILYCLNKNVQKKWSPVFTFNESIYRYFTGTRTVSTGVINQASVSNHVKTFAFHVLHPKDEKILRSIQEFSDSSNLSNMSMWDELLRENGLKSCIECESLDTVTQYIQLVPLWQLQDNETKKCSFFIKELPSDGSKRIEGRFEFLGFVPIQKIQKLGNYALYQNNTGDFIITSDDQSNDSDATLFVSFWEDESSCIDHLNQFKVKSETTIDQPDNSEHMEIINQENNSKSLDSDSQEIFKNNNLINYNLNNIEENISKLNINNEIHTNNIENSPTTQISGNLNNIDNSSIDLSNNSFNTHNNGTSDNNENTDLIREIADIEEIKAHIVGIKESNSKIALIEKHLNELISLTKRECNKMEFFKLEGVNAMMLLLQTQWQVHTSNIILPVFSIFSNLALPTIVSTTNSNSNSKNSVYCKLLEQDGVMEQSWLLLKVHIKNKLIVKSCLVMINNISSQNEVMPFFSKHPDEIPILLSLIKKESFQNDMRIVHLCLQSCAYASKFAYLANEKQTFQHILERLNFILDTIQLYEFNQRLVTSSLEILKYVALTFNHSSDPKKENLEPYILNISKIIAKLSKNFKRDSLVLTFILEIIIALDVKPKELLINEDYEFLYKQSFQLAKEESDSHSISKKLFTSVFSKE